MSFRNVFIAIFLGTALLAAAWLINSQRPPQQVEQPTAEMVKATGKCAECHRQETEAVVHQFEMSRHAEEGVNCLDCHQALEGQKALDHKGFEITNQPTSKNCAYCHTTQYEQYARSRHAAPAWAAVAGRDAFTEEQYAHAAKYHEAAMDRPANALAQLEGEAAIAKGCAGCHKIGKPNDDGSLGSCTECHSRHNTSISLARQPQTCGQCHMGPDHSQLEIYNESKHGAMFAMQKDSMDLDAPPAELGVEDMPIPTCSTCHMSGLEGMKVTHDTTERLSWYLYAPVSKKRPAYKRGQDEMKGMCLKCHTKGNVDRFYEEAEAVVDKTNEHVLNVKSEVDDLRQEGLLTPEPFDEPIEFLYFDYWHYYGRTAKHGAFMGGADFVQWHGNYELLLLAKEIEEKAHEIRERGQKSQRKAGAAESGQESRDSSEDQPEGAEAGSQGNPSDQGDRAP